MQSDTVAIAFPVDSFPLRPDQTPSARQFRRGRLGAMQDRTSILETSRPGDRIAEIAISAPILVIAAYFLVQVLIRTWLGAPPNLDEAEQFAISDHFAFGYGPHPPLYQWLQTAAFQVFGVNFFAIAVVKNALLFGTWAMLFLLGTKVTGEPRLAAIAGLGLLFSPNFAWESQIDHTHTVSNTFLAVLATYWMFSLLERRSPLLYAALGITFGLGLLAKYNFALFLVALVIAFASDRKARPVVLTPWFAGALVLAAAVAAGHYLYILSNPVAGTAKLGELGLNRLGFVETRIEGIASFAAALAGVHGIWLLLVLLGFIDRWRNPRPPVPGMDEDHQHRSRLLLRLWLLLFGTFAGLVIVGGTTNFRDHWLQPEAVFFPLVLAIVFARQIDAIAFRRLTLAAAILMIAIPVAVIANKRLFPGAQRDATMPDPAAIATIAPEVADGSLPIVILADDGKSRWFAAGHLRYWLQIPVPRFDGSLPQSDGGLPAILFNAGNESPETAFARLAGENVSRYGTRQPVPFFRPDDAGSASGTWFLVKP
jgi:4-amino-4-deoxy-L-arabinose transferase-like glycosyltransferase